MLDQVLADPTARIYLWSIGVCFFLSFFFAIAETALTSLSHVQAEKIASRPGWFSRGLRYWIDHPHRLLTTILVGDTLADTATATLAAAFMARHFPEVHILVVTTVLTIVILLFGKIAPKMVARSYSEQIAPISIRLLLVVNFILYPISSSITVVLSKLMRIVGLNLSSNPAIRSGDIEDLVALAARRGSIEKDKTNILSSIFQFSKRRVRDIMIPRDRISAISVDSTLIEVLDIIRQENHSRYPVYKNDLDRIVGFLHVRDLFGVLRTYGFSKDNPVPLENFSLRTCLRRAFFITEQALISRVMHEMKTNRIHLAMVKDEWGNVVGLITLEDILEEVFGEIEDEHDDHRPQPVIDLYATGIEVPGNEPLVDLKAKYGVEVEPSEAYSTINGFLQHYAPHQQLTPKTVIIWNSYVFSILSVKDGQVERIRITEIPGDKDKDRD